VSVQSRCNCFNSSSGYYCQYDAQDPYVSEQVHAMANATNGGWCNEYFCDYFQGQKQNNFTQCSEFCDKVSDIKTCWRTASPCPGQPNIELMKLIDDIADDGTVS